MIVRMHAVPAEILRLSAAGDDRVRDGVHHWMT